MVLSCLSLPLNPSPCHGKGKGWREQLCFYSCKISTLMTATFLSLLSGHTDCISRGLVRSLPCSGTAALCAACGKTGISASDQRGAVGLNCPPAGHPPKMSVQNLKVQAHKQNLYHHLHLSRMGACPILNTCCLWPSQAPAPASMAMSLLKISRKLNREGWWVSFDFELSGDPSLQAEAQLNLTVNVGCIPHLVQVTGGWPE